MSYIKVPSWIDLVLLGFKLPRKYLRGVHEDQTQPFWKEQTLRFGFDIREAENILWQSYFYERFFSYTLKRIDNCLQNLTTWERQFWQRNGRFVERLELISSSQQDLEIMTRWFPNLKMLTLKRCNTLIQSNSSFITSFSRLETLEISDSHLLSEKTFANIPEGVKVLIIRSAKSITNEFFDYLSTLNELTSLSLINCPSIELNQITKLPQTLSELDLSGSGKNIQPDICFTLPKGLTSLKMNRFSHFTDKELANLPKELHTLEVEGWQIASLDNISSLPLESLNLTNTNCHDFKKIPKTVKKLKIGENPLFGEDLSDLPMCEELDISYIQGFGGSLEDTPIIFPKTLKKLSLAYSGPLHKKTIKGLKNLTSLQKLSLAGCKIENSDLESLPPHIVSLDLALSHDLTDVGLILLHALSSLKTLSLDGADQIRGFGLSRLSPTIKKLSLAGCNRFSGKSLIELPKELEELFLDACELVMVDDLHDLPRALQVLSLARCPHIGNEATDILSSLPLLNTIILKGCPKITEDAIEKLVRRKFEGTIIIKSDIELHPSVSILKKCINFKARLIHKLKQK